MKIFVQYLNGHLIFLTVIMTGSVFMNPCLAARTNYSLGIEASYTDNSTLVADDPIDDLIRSALLGFEFNEDSSIVQANVRSLAQYRDYREDSFSDEVLLYLSLDSTFTLRPSSFFWKFEDYFSQQQLDNLTPGTPDNLINTNVFSTGPDFFFRISSSDSLYVGSRINDYNFENEDVNNSRLILSLAYIAGISSSVDMSLNAQYQDATYDTLEVADFLRQDLFLRFDSRPSRSQFVLDLGLSYIDRDETLEDVDGYLARLLWHNQFREYSYFRLNALSQYTDSSLNLLSSGAQTIQFDRAGSQINGDIFKEQRIEAMYHFATSSSSYNVQARFSEEDYEVLPQDRLSRGANFNYTHILSRTTNLTAYLRYQKYVYRDVEQRDTQRVGGLSLNYRLSRKYTFRFEYTLNSQDSNVQIAQYDENRIFISFFYGLDPGTYR